MSMEEQDAVIGRMIRERNECQRHLLALGLELRMVGEKLRSLGISLASIPDYPEGAVTSRGAPVDIENTLKQVRVERLVELAKEFYAEHSKHKYLSEQVAKLGI